MQTLQRRINAFDVNDERNSDRRADGKNGNKKMPSASKLLAEKRPLTCDEQTSIIAEAEESLLFNDKLATNAFALLVAAEGFVFLFFAITDLRTWLFRTQASDAEMAMKGGGVGGGGQGAAVDTLFEALSHAIVCLLALFCAKRINGKRSLRQFIVRPLVGARRRGASVSSRAGSRAGSRRGSMLITSEPPPPLRRAEEEGCATVAAAAFPPPPEGLVDVAVPNFFPPPPAPPAAPQFPPPPPAPPSFRGSSLLESVTSPKPARPSNANNNSGDYFNSSAAAPAGPPTGAEEEDNDEGPTITIELHEPNIRAVQTTHRSTAVLSILLAAPLIALSALMSSTGESLFAPRRLLLCLWQPLQHLLMAWAARALVEDVVTSIDALKRARYKYQDA